MPPRIPLPLLHCLKAPNVSRTTPTARTFTSSPASQASTIAQKRRYRDPYAIAQAKARKAANLSRQEVLKQERAAALGDPVRGITTPFLQSFDTALPHQPEGDTPTSTKTRISTSPDDTAPGPQTDQDTHLNFFLHKAELDEALSRSHWLTTPDSEPDERARDVTEELSREERAERRLREQDTAAEALQRIASLSLGSSKDRLRVNTQRCIDSFGRHNTDTTLHTRAAALGQLNPGPQPEKTPRAGPDTGSSEVQIAILTAKIRTLADFLQGRGRMDKANKRNLRLLVHRRQKLLRYLRRKERGGPRWQNVVEALGLTDGTWKGEISL